VTTVNRRGAYMAFEHDRPEDWRWLAAWQPSVVRLMLNGKYTDPASVSVDRIRRGHQTVPGALILLRCWDVDDRRGVAVQDWDLTSGGGTVLYSERPDFWHVLLYTAQEEAAVHEAAHVWWYLWQNDERTAWLIREYLRQAELVHSGEYGRVRRICHEGVYGNDRGFKGYWLDAPYNRWNADEMFAGLASGIMGDVALLPPELREIYGHMFEPGEMVYIPAMMRSE